VVLSTAVQTLTNKSITPRVLVMADATSFTPAVPTTTGETVTADICTQANTQAIGPLTANAPTGTSVNGQVLLIRIKSTNVQTFAWNAAYRGGTVALPTVTTGGGKYDYFWFIRNTPDSKWDYTRSSLGF
jgi:hypothetical protein